MSFKNIIFTGTFQIDFEFYDILEYNILYIHFHRNCTFLYLVMGVLLCDDHDENVGTSNSLFVNNTAAAQSNLVLTNHTSNTQYR
jgi:hypothetical protein